MRANQKIKRMDIEKMRSSSLEVEFILVIRARVIGTD